MNGFSDNIFNIDFKTSFLENTLEHLVKCSNKMKYDCLKTGEYLHDNEDKISARLVEKYLNENELYLRFIPQKSENYDPKNDTYLGRTDITVVSKDWFKDSKCYYIIECKRLDGKAYLNREYINEGIARFVATPTKYPSYKNQNIMFGYIVKNIDIPKNTAKLEKLQNKLLNGINAGSYILISYVDSEHYIYSCKYHSEAYMIELKHLFYNFSDVINP